MKNIRGIGGLSLVKRSLRLSRALARDNGGATLIEFAIVAPALIALLLACVATSITFFAQQSLETAAEIASRKITTGQVQAAGMTQAQFKAMTCQGLQSILTCGNLMIDVQTASTFSSINTASPTLTFDKNGNVTNSWQFTPGGSGDIVILRLMYLWSMPNGPLGFSINNLGGSQRLLIATAVAKTEPY